MGITLHTLQMKGFNPIRELTLEAIYPYLGIIVVEADDALELVSNPLPCISHHMNPWSNGRLELRQILALFARSPILQYDWSDIIPAANRNKGSLKFYFFS